MFRSEQQVEAVVRLDKRDSNGTLVKPLQVGVSRLMALSLKKEAVWYGFVISDAPVQFIAPGTEASVKIAFLDEVGATKDFSKETSILFGNGTSSQGVLLLR